MAVLLRLEEISQKRGANIIAAPMMVRGYKVMSLSNCWLRRPTTLSPSHFAFVIDPGRRRAEDQDRHGKNDDKEDPRQRRRIAHAEKLEGILIEIQHIKERGITRSPF